MQKENSKSQQFILIDNLPALDKYAKDKSIVTNYAESGEHVPRAEYNNRLTKERVRYIYYQLPCTHLPKTMIECITMESTKKLNFFPAHHGVLKYYSPRMILH